MPVVDAADMDERMAMLLDEMHRVAATHHCFLEASVRAEDGRHWD